MIAEKKCVTSGNSCYQDVSNASNDDNFRVIESPIRSLKGHGWRESVTDTTQPMAQKSSAVVELGVTGVLGALGLWL